MVRVLVVDGQAEVRRGLLMRLAVEPDVEVVGETGKPGEALYLAQALNPDVIVADIQLHSGEGIGFLHRLRAMAPAACIIVLTLRGDEVMHTRALEAGAQAFLEKRGGAADLLKAIRVLAARQTLDGRQIMAGVWAARRRASDEIRTASSDE
jgi:DNA-binding NarL/FixJ family response regulator